MIDIQRGEEILRVENLHVEFSSHSNVRKVVKGVTFSLKKGETLGLVGESGSGKSVSALAIMGLSDKNHAKITSGSIVFNSSVDLLQLEEKEMRKYRGSKIAMIFQEPMTSLNPVKRCGKQVMEMILQHTKCSKAQAQKQTKQLFEEVLLPDVDKAFNSYPHELSGGQKQRVMIAMAVACKPDVLIADEPTTALDVSVQKAVLDLIKSIQQKYGMGVFFISHDLGIVHSIADTIAVIYKGEIVEQGDKDKIFNSPSHPYTKGLLACRPPIDTRPLRLPTVDDYLSGKPINTRSESKQARQLLHEKIYSQAPILQVEDLEVEYVLSRNFFGKSTKVFKALDKVSFDLYEGETLGLVGESGSGKTTIGRAIMKLIQTSSGNIIYKGKSISNVSKSELKELRKQIQIIFQDPYSSLNPKITIGEVIEEPLKVHKVEPDEKKRRQMVIDMMQKVGLEASFFNRYPHEFSGGQRQRVGIARALILNPKIVICDESVSALDVSIQAQVLNLLSDLKRDMGLTYIFISHDLAVVKYVSDRMMVIRGGKMMAQDEADSLYYNSSNEYVKKLIASIPV
ncbi:MAG: ABC transporter ATP-binding protein [Candidatus Onthomorpha sp.]